MEIVVFTVIIIVIFLYFSIAFKKKKNKKTAEDWQAYSSAVESAKRSLITGAESARLPVLSADEYGYRPVSKEKLFAVQNGVTRMEMKSIGSYRTSGHAVSIPIMKGVRYRIGAGAIRTEKAWQATAAGRLLVTDKAIVFEGGQKNERITWTQVASIDLLLDGFTIAKRTGPPRTYQVDSPDPKFAAVVEIMLAATS